MKRFGLLIVGMMAGLVTGGVVSFVFNTWYSARYVRSDDDANFLVSLLLFGFLPAFAALGVLIAYRWSARRSS